MQVIPVLDLRAGVVVRGVGGRRSEYQPISSKLTKSVCPAHVARAFRDHFGLSRIYLADLDAITGGPPALPIYCELMSLGFQMLVDAGIHDFSDARPLIDLGIGDIVAGLETLSGPDALTRLCCGVGAGRIVFSLDLNRGRPIGNTPLWGSSTPFAIAEKAIECGARRMIVLDLARVGVNEGTGTEELCAQLVATYPNVFVIAGGGVRGVDDLRRLQQRGIQGVLVASALHDGRLTASDLKML